MIEVISFAIGIGVGIFLFILYMVQEIRRTNRYNWMIKTGLQESVRIIDPEQAKR